MGQFETFEALGKPARQYVAGDRAAGAPGVVVLHPWWGLNKDVTAYADRLAAAGFVVAAPDLFDGQVASTIEDAERLSSAGDDAVESLNAIVLASVDRLADRLAPPSKLATLGFSFGAHWAMWAPTERDRVVASVVYYGSTSGGVLNRSTAPVLGHFAEFDPYETDEGIAEFEEALRSAGRDVTIHRYPDTGHWFAEPSQDAYRPEAADLAFERTMTFLRECLSA
jgi:carboxymethylenebutenolidase